MSLFRDAFPNWDGGELYIPKGWIDNSYKNDTCPRAMYRIESETKTVECSLWQDYVDVDKREYDYTKRYIFQIHVNEDLVYHYETDDLSEAKKLAEGVQI